MNELEKYTTEELVNEIKGRSDISFYLGREAYDPSGELAHQLEMVKNLSSEMMECFHSRERTIRYFWGAVVGLVIPLAISVPLTMFILSIIR
ncbi:MAG: hypothetical protein FWB93_02805 [Oscillospiraceae bacterium]|nr:hypothetical protein [Oscillospiraceae bacterium]